MYNVEEKTGSVSQNGLGLNNEAVLGNKETDDTWADLDKAIDQEINGCSDDATENSNQNGLNSHILDDTKVNSLSCKKSNKAKNKNENEVIELDDSDKDNTTSINDKIPGKPLNQSRVADELLSDEPIPMVEQKSTTKTTNGTIKINLIKSKCETSAQKPSQTIPASLGSNKSAQKLTGSREPNTSSTDKSNHLKDANAYENQSLAVDDTRDSNVEINDGPTKSRLNGAIKSSNVSTKDISTNKLSNKREDTATVLKTIEADKVKKEEAKECMANSKQVNSENDTKETLSKTCANGTKLELKSEDPNYDTALQELSDITQYAKLLDDDHLITTLSSNSSSLSSSNSVQDKKRKSGDLPDEATASKRSKLIEEDEKGTSQVDTGAAQSHAAAKAVKKQLKKVSRNEIEDLVARKVVEVISCRSEIGELRAKCDKFEEMNEKWKRKTQALQKMCQDLNTVIKRYIIDVQKKKDNPSPIKITRSVGLQVCADQRRRPPVQQPQQHQLQNQGSSQPSKQGLLPKTSSLSSGIPQRVAIAAGGTPQSSTAVKGSLPNSTAHPVASTASSNNPIASPKQLHNSSTILTPSPNIITHAGQHRGNHSLSTPVNRVGASSTNIQQNSQQITSDSSNPSIVTITPSTKGYILTQPVAVPAASSNITAAQNNQRSTTTPVTLSNTVPQVSSSQAGNISIPNSITVSKASPVLSSTVEPSSNPTGLASATAASNKVIDLVELSDEEDGITPPPIQQPPQKQPPAPRSQPHGTRPTASNTLFQNQHLPQHKPQQTINRIHAPSNASRALGNGSAAVASNPTGIRPMVFANQMANGVNVHRPPPGQVIQYSRNVPLSHPARLPEMPNPQPHAPSWKKLPPRPTLKISRLKSGIVLSWNMDVIPTEHAAVASYQIYAYQEGSAAPQSGLWKKVGDVKALPLPMACTLTQFTKGNKYHFAVRAQDVHSRVGTYSEPQSIALT